MSHGSSKELDIIVAEDIHLNRVQRNVPPNANVSCQKQSTLNYPVTPQA